MIKADGSAKVKKKLGFDAATLSTVFAVVLAVFPFASVQAQLSEKEVQGAEAQEFGLQGSQKKTPVAAPSLNPEKEPLLPSEAGKASSPSDQIKEIDAEEFGVQSLKKSRSGRVVLFADTKGDNPRPGRILLMKEGPDDIVAVRVLKNYEGKFAAKIVLRFKDIEVGKDYRALKKLGDRMMALFKEKERQGKDLDSTKTDEDLALEVAPDDDELDRGIPRPTKAAKKAKAPEPLFTKDGAELTPESIEVKDEDEPYPELAVQEDVPLEPHKHAVSVEYAQMRGVDKTGNTTSYQSYGARYGFNFWRMPFFKRRSLQDMLTVELGIFQYSIDGFSQPKDSVSLLPIIGTVRYNLLTGENLMFFGYLGFVKNNIMQNTGLSAADAAVLGRTTTALGLGAMIKIGPAWAVRLDFGLDLFAVGAVLKF